MATFKAEVYKHHKKEDGTYNVKIRVTHNRAKKYLSTTKYITKDDLTKSFKIKNQSIIDDLDALMKRYRDACNELGEKSKDMTIEQIVHYLEAYKGKDAFTLDFIRFGRDKIEQLKASGHSGNARTYEVMLNALTKFTDRESLNISEITVRFLNDFVNWIETRPVNPKRKKGQRAASLYLSNLRALHNMAKNEFNDEDAGIINIPFSPFAKFKVPSTPLTRKRALSADAIKAIAALPYKEVTQPGMNRFNLAKDMFVLSFALIGMNSVDLYNCDCIKDGRIIYQRTKTKNRRQDRAEISIKIEPEILPLIEKYKDTTGERVFNFHRLYKDSIIFNSAINKGLKQIGSALETEDLEFYAARHSWATIATNSVKVDKYVVHKALNHVDEMMKVTDIYIAPDDSLIDTANRNVLDYLGLDIGSVTEVKKINYR